MQLKVYDIVLEDGDGISAISFVESPAIETNFVALSKFSIKKEVKMSVDSKRRVIYTPVLIPDKEIYRKNEKEEYFIRFSKQEVRKIAENYVKKAQFAFNLEHSDKVDGVYPIETYIVDYNRGVNAPIEFQGVADGTWIAGFKIENDDLWKQVEDGHNFKGVSIEGIFSMIDAKLSKHEIDESEIIINQIIRILNHEK